MTFHLFISLTFMALALMWTIIGAAKIAILEGNDDKKNAILIWMAVSFLNVMVLMFLGYSVLRDLLT